jgi:GAF domain-containing protein
MSNGREAQVVDTFLALTDTLVRDFDPLDMLTMLAQRCVELLDVSAAGIILTDRDRGGLSVAAASSERSWLLEVFAVAIDDGPCVDCARTGEPVIVADLTCDDAARRWPRFVAGASEAGFRAVHALPMRSRGQVIGGAGPAAHRPARLLVRRKGPSSTARGPLPLLLNTARIKRPRAPTAPTRTASPVAVPAQDRRAINPHTKRGRCGGRWCG